MAVEEELHPRFLACVVYGAYSDISGPASAERFWTDLAERCRRHGRKRLLLDLRDVTGTLTTLDRYTLGSTFATAFQHRGLRTAVLIRAEQRDPEHFAELVATNRGAIVRGFTERTEALQWLLQ